MPIARTIIETENDIYGKELTDLILQTNNLLKEYANSGDKENAAGVKLLNETFRCLAHPNLTHFGKEIWIYFSKSKKQTKEYLNNLEIKFNEQENQDMVDKIREAKEFISLIPTRFR